MTQDSLHSASGQALGYVHQCMWALVELGKRANVDPATQLRLEALDDVEFENSGTASELLQTKHHVGQSSPITASSVDLWRTLNVWMDLPSSDFFELHLVTTQNLSDTSGLVTLRRGGTRNTSAALDDLLQAAETSRNKTTEPWRQKFKELDEESQFELVDRITIEDGSLTADRIDEDLVKIFRYSYPPGHEQVFLHLLKGWWSGISVQLLSRTLESVSGDDLILQVAEITDQLRSDTLPVDPDVMQALDESISELYKDRPFVQQLLWIAFENNRLWKAIRDYHRSYAQRSFWLRHQLLSETELDRFAFKLFDEWEQLFDASVAAMKRKQREDSDIVGQEILEQLARESRARLRNRFDEPWFNRGMFHALADGELGYRIGWHPDFETKLEEMLSNVTTT
ncbi:ABC-three component system protein [Paenarthrobacter aromaticivorans]|uniref:ABC-three component systems C-terminal domain-containing protein n=1 Tax=Paenarthrobacter aromaticivorans TaxID=2849150 RepID=A0ABS6I1G2_9MICC|nr:ABC-three component system protein [Paenarthrobacter sp. MMS21-TAE1-1]MBU8865586.1 hypothetical protein [Paenarthrobacter sp. MMS21-TAE1-1]